MHLHFEGAIPKKTLLAIAARNGHAFGVPGAFELARSRSRQARTFLRLFADCCRLFQNPDDYAQGARALGLALARELTHAEIYVSPEIWSRFSRDPRQILRRIDRTLADVEHETGCRLLLLLDSVRQWGPEAAERVLDLHEELKLARVVGFGIGGEENSVPARKFRRVYDRARRLGLKTAIHAGEWGGPESVAAALDELGPDRIDHGIAAARDRRLLARLAKSGVTLCVAPSSNIATGACASWREHPLPRLLAAGVRVCLGADDPTIFETTTMTEYSRARRKFGLTGRDAAAMMARAAAARFEPRYAERARS